MKLSVTRKVSLGFAASLAILAVISSTSFLTTQELIGSIQSVAHSYRVLAELRDVHTTARDIQASSRGYIISGQQSFLEPYEEAIQSIAGEIAQVRALTILKEAQQRRLAAVEQLVAQQLAFTKQTIEIRKSQGFEAAEKRVSSGQGQQIVGQIVAIIAEMMEVEEKLLAGRNERAARNAVWANWVIYLGGVMTLVIVAIATLVLHHDIRQREHLERAILEVSDREQQRFGRDLHDSLCQELAGIAFMSQVAERNLASLVPDQAAEVGRIATLIGESVGHARSLARGLQPVEVEANGLMVALEELARTVREMFRVECNMVCDAPVLLGDNAVAVHLYRIAQEAVYNAIRHGHAKHIVIRLHRERYGGRLEVQDDGKGLPAELPKKRGMGLATMNYRAAVIGATLKFERPSGGGTCVSCLFQGLTAKSAPAASAGAGHV